MNEFKVGDIIRNYNAHNKDTYIVTDVHLNDYYRYHLLCLDNNQSTRLPYEYQYLYYVVKRAE